MTAVTSPFQSSPSFSTAREALSKSNSSWLRKIAIITTSRADAGIYQSLLNTLTSQSPWQTICLVGGNHHSTQFGTTVDAIPRLRGLEIVPVEHFTDGDRPEDVACTAGQAVIEFSKALAKHSPDLVFVLGDRTEMLAASLAALIHKVPIAHLHGGDTTLGAYDEQCRHAITKMSHVHFAAMPEHAWRIEMLGEEAWRIHVVGALALDGLKDFQPWPAAEISSRVGVDLTKPMIIVVFHPETMANTLPIHQIDTLLSALDTSDVYMLLIGPNADVGHAPFEARLREFAAARRGRAFAPSLSQEDFWGCLAHATALVGNSSAGIIEAASFRLPVVNIGRRQAGRIRPRNVLDADLDVRPIRAAMDRAMSTDFRASLADLTNPYGDGQTAKRIVALLKALPSRETLLQKK
jgi:UDP-hydrolysing UDP-N-acetyl-D-glucosamine 2-epimerase